MALKCITSLSDVTGLFAPFDSCCPHCKQEKVRRAPYPEGNNPSALRLSKIKNPPRLGDQNSEALLWVLSEPAAIELVARGRLDGALRTFGDYGDVRAEVTHETALLRETHLAIPNKNPQRPYLTQFV